MNYANHSYTTKNIQGQGLSVTMPKEAETQKLATSESLEDVPNTNIAH